MFERPLLLYINRSKRKTKNTNQRYYAFTQVLLTRGISDDLWVINRYKECAPSSWTSKVNTLVDRERTYMWWSPECQNSFILLKDLLTREFRTLAFLKRDQKFYLETNASNTIIVTRLRPISHTYCSLNFWHRYVSLRCKKRTGNFKRINNH